MKSWYNFGDKLYSHAFITNHSYSHHLMPITKWAVKEMNVDPIEVKIGKWSCPSTLKIRAKYNNNTNHKHEFYIRKIEHNITMDVKELKRQVFPF